MPARSTLGAVVALALATATPAVAQNRGAMMLERQQALVDTVVTQLALSGEREQAFRAVITEQGERMLKVFEEYQGRRDPAMRDQLLAIQAETDEALATLLSEEEMARFVDLRAAHRQQMRNNRQPPG